MDPATNEAKKEAEFARVRSAHEEDPMAIDYVQEAAAAFWLEDWAAMSPNARRVYREYDGAFVAVDAGPPSFLERIYRGVTRQELREAIEEGEHDGRRP